jgi:SAM-dependent methyltransferase
MEHIKCPLCGSDKARRLFERPDLSYRTTEVLFSVVRCRRCSLVYVNPRPTEEEIHTYYPEQFYEPGADPNQLLLAKNDELCLKHQYVSDIAPGRLLDVGCSKGEFMMFMKKRGWAVAGIDFSRKPPDLFGLDIFHGSLESADFAKESFDLISLWAVLEHVYDPTKMLRLINQLLKPGGTVILAVTNFNSLPGRLMRQDDVPRHTILFTRRTISRFLKSSGFGVDYIVCDRKLYGGSNRGILNFLFKLAAGEKIQDVVAQSRSAEHWYRFSSQLHGTDSRWMLRVDRADIAWTPRLDPLIDWLGFGFIMVARATKPQVTLGSQASNGATRKTLRCSRSDDANGRTCRE